MAVLTKSGIDQRLQHLPNGLLDQAVDQGGYPQLAFAAIWLLTPSPLSGIRRDLTGKNALLPRTTAQSTSPDP
jgi:hypothetical protein